MPFTYLQPNTILTDTTAKSTTAVLYKVSTLLSQAHSALNADDLFDMFWERERLGSTTIGHGVLIPHIRISPIQSIHGCFIQLKYPVDFGAIDKQLVDLVFGLIVPPSHTQQHLDALADITHFFSHTALRDACRNAKDIETLQRILFSYGRKTTHIHTLELT